MPRRPRPPIAPPPADPEARVRQIDELYRRVVDRVPNLDQGDLRLILGTLLQPPGTGRRFFLRELRPGVHVR